MYRIALLALFALAPFAHADEPRVLKNIAYGPHERNKLDITIPASDKPLPLLIWIHGGGWAMGRQVGRQPCHAAYGRGVRRRVNQLSL